MKLAIMQPYFFPYIGYFQLINAVDKFVIFDDIQFIRHGWINRNRILSPNLEKKWQYFIVPLEKHAKEEVIKNIKIKPSENWKNNIIGKLSYYKKIRVPYYENVLEIVDDCLSYKATFINDLNIYTLKRVADYIGINFDYIVSSKHGFDYSAVRDAGDWALESSRQMNASIYINPISGKEIFDKDKFNNEGISINFIQPRDIVYKQSRRDYVPWLSIIDVMMFNSPVKIKKMLNEYELI